MARPRTLNRERLLDVAEGIVAKSGAVGLTFGNLATAAAMPKASIQSAFGSREALMEAVLARWLVREQARFEARLGERSSDRDRMLAHVRLTAELTHEESTSVAGLMTALASVKDAESSLARWYRARAGTLEAKTDQARRLRLAFLAAEGAYYLRYVFGFPISDEMWNEIFSDLGAYAEA